MQLRSTGLFHLDWFVDLDGYRVERRPVTPSLEDVARSLEDPSVLDERFIDCIVRKGGQLEMRTPLKVPGLCRRLADCPKTNEAVIGFVSRFGPLFGPDPEPLSEIYDAIDVAQGLVALAETEDWHSIAVWLDKAWIDALPSQAGGIGRLGIAFSKAGNERPRLQLQPPNLFHAALVQFLEEVSSGGPLRRCRLPTCPEWFTYGPHTGRRETALYCSPRCQNAHTYLKRKESRS
jgi:hypothetical protein